MPLPNARERRRDWRAVVTAAAVFGIVVPIGTGLHAEDWGYSGTHGPRFWAKTPGWEACAGTAATERQSPIDIDEVVADKELTRLQADLKETPVAVVNNGHTIEEEYRLGSSLTLAGVRYDLKQFHFHTPSEHTVRGAHAAMEMHVVFKDAGSDKLVVIGVLFEVGKANAFLSALMADGLPGKRGEEVDAHSRPVNVAQALTDTSQYYTYPGSLTTPPCSENVTWFVLKGRPEMSAEQLAAFHRVLGDNARPVQKLNHRVAHETVSGAR